MSVWTSVLILSNSDWNYVTPGIGECGWEDVHGECAWRVCMGRQKGINKQVKREIFGVVQVKFNVRSHGFLLKLRCNENLIFFII